MMPVTIRRFRKQDALPAGKIIEECFRKLDIGGHTPKGIALQIDRNRPEQIRERAKTVKLYAAREGNRVVGIGGYDETKVHTLFVRIDRHKKGVGEALLDRILSDAKKDGLTALLTWSTLYAKGFYAKHGFVEKRVLKLPEGADDITLVEMERRL